MNRKVALYVYKMEEYLKKLKYSPSTIKMYKSVILDYYNNCACRSICRCDPCRCTRQDIERFVKIKKSQGRSSRTLNLYINIFRLFFEKIVGVNNINIPYEKINPKRKLKTITEKQFNALLKSDIDDKYKMAIFLSFRIGLSLSEIVNLKISDFNRKKECLYVRGTNREIKRVVYLPDDVLMITGRYVLGRSKDEYLISGKSGGRISERAVQKEFKKACRYAGINNVSFSALRDTFIFNLKANGVKDSDLMQILGLKNPRTVKRYII